MSNDEENLDREEWNDVHAVDIDMTLNKEGVEHIGHAIATSFVRGMSIDQLLVLARRIWGAPPVGRDVTSQLPPVVVRLVVTVGDVARIAREYGSDHWRDLQGEREPRIAARNELKKELGNIIFSVIRWCDDLDLDPAECIALGIKAQAEYAASKKKR